MKIKVLKDCNWSFHPAEKVITFKQDVIYDIADDKAVRMIDKKYAKKFKAEKSEAVNVEEAKTAEEVAKEAKAEAEAKAAAEAQAEAEAQAANKKEGKTKKGK